MTSRNGAGAFLGGPFTSGYKPSIHGWAWDIWQSGQRGFWLQDVELMRRDAQIIFGTRILISPLSTLTWEIDGDPPVVDYVDRQLKRFWKHDLVKALKLIPWGFTGGEVVWREHLGQIQFDYLRDLHPLDCIPMEIGGRLTGLKVKNTSDPAFHDNIPTLRPPRIFWAAHEPEYGQMFGRSVYAGAWKPWMEKTGRHGALDSRRLWYVKNAFRGGTIRHPPGTIQIDDAGTTKSCQDYARELLEKFETGGILVLPNFKDPETGDYEWTYDPPAVNGDLRDIRDYPKDLDAEMLRGMNIPPEVIQASETGSGWSGRAVPFLVFLTGEDQYANTIIDAFDRYIARPGVMVNFGPKQFEIRPTSLVKLAEEKAEKAPQQPGQVPREIPAEQNRFNAPATPIKQPQPTRMSLGSKIIISDKIRQKVREKLNRGAACMRPSTNDEMSKP